MKSTDLLHLPVACLQQPAPTCRQTTAIVRGENPSITIDGVPTVTEDVQILTDGGATIEVVSESMARITGSDGVREHLVLELFTHAGTPLAKMRVAVTLPDGQQVEATTDAQGRLELRNVPPGGSLRIEPLE